MPVRRGPPARFEGGRRRAPSYFFGRGFFCFGGREAA